MTMTFFMFNALEFHFKYNNVKENHCFKYVLPEVDKPEPQISSI